MTKRHLSFVVLIVCCFVLLNRVDGSRILVAAPYGTKSHQNMFIPLVKELAHRDHHITVITNYATPDFKKMDNEIREIIIDELAIEMSAFISNMFDYVLSPWTLKSIQETMEMMSASVAIFQDKVADATFDDPRVRDLIVNEKFDIVLISEASGIFGLPFAWQYKAPYIMLSPNVLFLGRATDLGDDEHYSYVPYIMSSYSDKMSFYQRTMNFILSKFGAAFAPFIYPKIWSSIEEKHLFNQLPDYHEMNKNISIILTNTHPSFSYPRTLPPQVIEVGGLHCRPAKPLSKDLEAFVSSSPDAGFILFAVGSALKMSDMPEEMVQSFIKVFSRLPQRVIWQWKGTPRSDLPSNVLAIPWLPQQDLLGHKGCRAFMTHGGLNSLQEAIYHGVPVIGMPFMTDQHLNVGRAVTDGYAVKLDWKELNEESLTKSLREILKNQNYKDAASSLSSLFRDQLQPPLDRAVFWTEFVLRHNGTEHLKLGSRDLTPLQRQLVDVYLILFMFAMLPLVFIYFCIRKCCCGGSREKKTLTNDKKKQ